MKRVLLLILFLILPTLARSQEVVSAFDNAGLVTMNEELRQSSSSLRNTKSLVTTLQADVDALEAKFAAFKSIPQGAIIMWSGTIATIPTGWELADGSCSITCPDLRNRFIVAADADVGGVAKSTVTGSALQTSDGVVPAHTHSILYGVGGPAAYTTLFVADTTNNGTTLTTSSYGSGTKNIAVFYALAYIIKT